MAILIGQSTATHFWVAKIGANQIEKSFVWRVLNKQYEGLFCKSKEQVNDHQPLQVFNMLITNLMTIAEN